ncbi:MAG: TetR/AcrR family transcriptional regulator [Gammaproteobacteria bacterium]|nr:TetR/AcrR family transcriptional regulator [Gammaproteobacteria bacterium]
MSEPRFQRRKEDRPAEITEAAMQAFSEKGYAATRVEEVAKRAGVSKGLLYLYFKTKEDLFKAVIKSFVSPRLDALIGHIESTELSAEAFLRGPFLDFAKSLPKSHARRLVRLLIAEGPKHPDLIAWYWENVVSRGLAALRTIIEKGVRSGEFKPSALEDFPQLLMSPVLLSMIWKQLFEAHAPLDTDAMLEGHINLLLNSIGKE